MRDRQRAGRGRKAPRRMEETMFKRTALLLAALSVLAGPASAEPKTNMLHQWAVGSDAAAIAKLGEMFTEAGGKWEQTSIAGHTANTLAKLRANVVAGDAPLEAEGDEGGRVDLECAGGDGILRRGGGFGLGAG